MVDGAVLNELVIPAVRDGGAFTAVRGFQGVPQRDIHFTTTFVRSYAQGGRSSIGSSNSRGRRNHASRGRNLPAGKGGRGSSAAGGGWYERTAGHPILIRKDPLIRGSQAITARSIVLPWSQRAFSLLKRWALGTYHGLRRKHVDAYLISMNSYFAIIAAFIGTSRSKRSSDSSRTAAQRPTATSSTATPAHHAAVRNDLLPIDRPDSRDKPPVGFPSSFRPQNLLGQKLGGSALHWPAECRRTGEMPFGMLPLSQEA